MAYIRLIRVYQWIKNTFVFLPLFFAGKMLSDPEALIALGGIFICFSLVASSIYILNDYMDRESDRQHPEKSLRPLASGEVSPTEGLILFALLMSVGMSGAWLLDTHAAIIIGIYFVMNVLYSIKLKHVPILDISIIATGFLLRILAGGFVADVELSRWIIVMTFLLALFMGIAKRREDVLLFNASGNKARKSIDGYNLDFINISLGLMSAVIIVAYLMYTMAEDTGVSSKHPDSYLTTVFVMLGILRYLQITMVENKSGSPTKILLKDRFIQFTVIAWIVSYYIFIYKS
jgi:decaprenyl-phosphate phosphoribosyltransferase